MVSLFINYGWYCKPEWVELSSLYITVNFQVFSFQVKKRNSEESSTQWTTGIAEVQLPIEYVYL